MNAESIVCLVLVVLLLGYLIVALLRAEDM